MKGKMVKVTLLLPEEVHEKLRWLSYRERRSQQAILRELVEGRLERVKMPRGHNEARKRGTD